MIDVINRVFNFLGLTIWVMVMYILANMALDSIRIQRMETAMQQARYDAAMQPHMSAARDYFQELSKQNNLGNQ